MRLMALSAFLVLEGFAICESNNDTETCEDKNKSGVCDDDSDSDADGSENDCNDAVLKQYMQFPYPPFGPKKIEEEREFYGRGEVMKLIHRNIVLQDLNHFLFRGKQTFRSKFRALFAAGGTGSATLFLAEQLNGTNAQVVYLDMSSASMKIAQQRAEVRNLRNVRFLRNWIENIPKLNLDKFNFIECSGALHHLKDPNEGLSALSDQLTSSGGMKLMVYAKYGRTGVYLMQDLLSLVNNNEKNMHKEIDDTKEILKALPDSNWFKKSKWFNKDLHLVKENEALDIHLYDLFLHKRDVSYTVEEFKKWIKNAGLYFVDFDNYIDRAHYVIESVVMFEDLAEKIRWNGNDAEVVEILRGTEIFKHDFYVSKVNDSEADIEDKDNVMFINGNPRKLKSLVESNPPNSERFNAMVSKIPPETKVRINWPLNPVQKAALLLLSRAGKTKSLKQLIKMVKKEHKFQLTDTQLKIMVKDLYFAAKRTGQILLKNRHVKDFPKSDDLQLYLFHK